jgi:hypothetical protein
LDLKNGLLLSFSAPVMSAWALDKAAANAPIDSLCIVILLHCVYGFVASVYALLFFTFLHLEILLMPPGHIVIVHGLLAPLPGCSRRRRTGR